MTRKEIESALSNIIDACEAAQENARDHENRMWAKLDANDPRVIEAQQDRIARDRAVYEAWKLFRQFCATGEIVPGP